MVFEGPMIGLVIGILIGLVFGLRKMLIMEQKIGRMLHKVERIDMKIEKELSGLTNKKKTTKKKKSKKKKK